MSNRLTICCDTCHKEIQSTKGFRLLANALIGAMSDKPGDFCISCLAERCGEKLMSPEDKRTLKAIEEEKWRQIDEELSRNRDW